MRSTISSYAPRLQRAQRSGANYGTRWTARFDFFFGKWNGHQRRLRERLIGCTDWEEFESTTDARLILDGIGNVDEVTMQRESGACRGFTVRLYNTETQEWSLYWATAAAARWCRRSIGQL